MFKPLSLGALKLEHRVVMAPLTRVRGTDTFAPPATAVEYYSQRATPGGLIITEASPISPETPYLYAPGIYTKEQEAGWAKVVEAVHAKRGLIAIQLWHVGRTAHASWGQHPFLKSLGRPLPTAGPSATRNMSDKTRVEEYPSGKMVPPGPVRALTKDDILRLVNDYREAALAAKRAGFDAIEVHAAHGYLINQFLCDGTNDRTDEFGGSVENRMRLLHMVLKAVTEVMGADRVGVRISPTYPDTRTYYECTDSNTEQLYRRVVESLNPYKLAYLLISEPRWSGGRDSFDPRTDPGFTAPLRCAWVKQVYTGGAVIGAGGFTPASAARSVEANDYDAIAFGRWFISNPDLVQRLKNGSPLNIYDRTSFYIRDPIKGYVDYPVYGQPSKYGAKYETMDQATIGQALRAPSKL